MCTHSHKWTGTVCGTACPSPLRCSAARSGQVAQLVEQRTEKTRGPVRAPRSVRAPSMYCGLEVEVLWGPGRGDPSEPQGGHREVSAEGSGERDPRVDV